jgi:hypothetical protein
MDFLSLSKNLQKLDLLQKNLIKNYYYGIYDRDTYYILMKKLKNISDEYNNLKASENCTIKQNIIEKNNSSIINEPLILIDTALQNGFKPEEYIYLNSMRMTLFELD